MNDDQEPRPHENDSADEELDSALEVLKNLPQREAAAEVGISERRFRDIERHRSTPRPKTRDLIIRLAQNVRADNSIGESIGEAQGDSENLVGPLIFGGLMLVGLIVILILLRPPEG